MSLDDLARRAAEQSREHAASGGDLDPERYRRRRERRNQARALVVSAAVVVVALLIGILVSPPEDEVAVTTSTLPSEITTTTLPVTTTTTGVSSPGEPGVILGAGWEALDPGPIAGRYRIAAVWTDHGLFVFGGHDNFLQDPPSVVLYHQDGFLYDPDTGVWSEIAEVFPETLCVGHSRALLMEDRVFVYGARRSPGCSRAAIYDLVSATWHEVPREFGDSIGSDSLLVWTGELLVAPTVGLAYDPASEETIEIPQPPEVLGQAIHSPPRAHWTGSEVLVVGSGPVHRWAPGDAVWQTLEGPPIPGRARDSVWTDEGFLVVNYQMATAFLDPETLEWSRPGDLPLRFYEDLPTALSVGGTPVVRMASGLAIWDGTLDRKAWVPVSPSYTEGEGWRDLVAGDDAIFSVGGGELLRFRIVRDGEGAIVPPPTLPIGVVLLDVPRGWELASSFAPLQSPEGFIPEDETIGLILINEGGTPLGTCLVSSTYTGGGTVVPADYVEAGHTIVERPGRASLTAMAYRGSDHDGFALAVPTGTSDVVLIRCEEGPDSSRFAESAMRIASGLWSPFDVDIGLDADARIITGTGWEELDGSPVAGRMRVATTWTGAELFVWGGHDGYSQETPGVDEFHQEAHLFEPTTDTWRRAADPPDGLCPLTEATATWIGDVVLIRGQAYGVDCATNVASYDPAEDSWTLWSGRFFEAAPYKAEVVWTGEWLAAPAFGVAWDPQDGGSVTIDIPVVPDSGFRVGSPTMFHWDGERIIAVGAGDVYSLRLGDEAWEHHAAIGIAQGGRRSVLTEHGLFVITRDGEGARVVDLTEVNLGENLPLRLSECDAFLVAAGDLPVAQVGCSGMAIWDPVRSFWVPIPMDVMSGWSWQPTLVGTDDAIYSIGERFLRYPISRHTDGTLFDSPTIPVGVMQLDLAPRAFRIRTTLGVSQVFWPEPDDWFGEVIAIALDAPGGLCHVAATYQGPTLGEPLDVLSVPRVARDWPVPRPERPLLEVLDYTEEGAPMTDWVIRSSPDSDSDVVGIQCESRDDALLLAKGLWLP